MLVSASKCAQNPGGSSPVSGDATAMGSHLPSSRCRRLAGAFLHARRARLNVEAPAATNEVDVETALPDLAPLNLGPPGPRTSGLQRPAGTRRRPTAIAEAP